MPLQMHPIFFLLIPGFILFCLYVIIFSLASIFCGARQRAYLRYLAKRQAAAHKERQLVDLQAF